MTGTLKATRHLARELAGPLDAAAPALDEAVHEAKAEEAAAINNGGITEQLEYLLDTLGEPAVRALIQGLPQR